MEQTSQVPVVAIERTNATECLARGYNYCTLPSQIIKALAATPDALAVYTAYLDMDSSWTPRKKEIRERMNLSEGRYVKAVKQLKAMGLWEQKKVRNQDGTFRVHDVTLHAFPIDAETSDVDIPASGESQCLSRDQSVNQRSISTKKQSTRRRTLAEDLNDHSWAEADSQNSDI